MSEAHHFTGPAHGEPLPAGRVGARVRMPLSGTPSPRWSTTLSAHLTCELMGHAAIGHLHVNDIVQGNDVVLEGVEGLQAADLGDCLQRAVEAANRVCGQEADGAAEPAGNMSRPEAEAIARELEERMARREVVAGAAGAR